jgi:hypothetical protein
VQGAPTWQFIAQPTWLDRQAVYLRRWPPLSLMGISTVSTLPLVGPP